MARPHRRVRGVPFLCLVFLALAGGSWATAQADPGATRAEPIPFGEEGIAGPLRIAVIDVVNGLEATSLVVEAGGGNTPPRDGVTYVAVNLRVTNGSERPVTLDQDDFALSGATGLVRRFVGVVPPAPALAGVVQPGETRQGWVVLSAAADETSPLLLFDSITLQGRWSDRVFALEDGASVADLGAALAEPDDVASDTAEPAGIGEPFTTGQWQIELVEIATCLEVFSLSDFRVQALTEEDASDEAPWIALLLRITNVGSGDEPAFLPPTAFMLVNGDGNAVSDVITLTAPYPDASGAYYPGATREGWVALEIPDTYVATDLSLIRFLPYRTDEDARYLTYAEELPVC